jgi:hypothetical protein
MKSWYMFGQHNRSILLGTLFNSAIPHDWHTYINTLREAQYSCFSILFGSPDCSFTILSPLLIKSLPLVSCCPSTQVHLPLYYQFYQLCNSSDNSAFQFPHLTDFADVRWSSISLEVVIQFLPFFWE